jgi:hypothetical protein
MTTPRGAPELVESQALPATTVNEQIRRTEAGACHFPVTDRVTAPPGSCSDGANYLIIATATGAFTGKENQIATAVGTNAASGWYYHTPVEGFSAWVMDENARYLFDGAAWGVEGATAITQGTHTIPIIAAALTANTTNGPASGTTETGTHKVMLSTLDFDQSTDESAQITIPMPKSWNEGTVTAQFGWTAGATGDVVWGCSAVALSDDDAVDAAFGTAQTVTDAVTAAGDLMWSAATAAITIAGTPAAEDLVVFKFYRDADNGADTLAADAKLIAVRIKFTINAGDDS